MTTFEIILAVVVALYGIVGVLAKYIWNSHILYVKESNVTLWKAISESNARIGELYSRTGNLRSDFSAFKVQLEAHSHKFADLKSDISKLSSDLSNGVHQLKDSIDNMKNFNGIKRN